MLMASLVGSVTLIPGFVAFPLASALLNSGAGMKILLKRYKYFLALLVINIVVYALYPAVGQKSVDITWSNTVEMLSVIPPIFILLGLLLPRWGGSSR
jgi:hypothetical protein